MFEVKKLQSEILVAYILSGLQSGCLHFVWNYLHFRRETISIIKGGPEWPLGHALTHAAIGLLVTIDLWSSGSSRLHVLHLSLATCSWLVETGDLRRLVTRKTWIFGNKSLSSSLWSRVFDPHLSCLMATKHCIFIFPNMCNWSHYFDVYWLYNLNCQTVKRSIKVE